MALMEEAACFILYTILNLFNALYMLRQYLRLIILFRKFSSR